MSHNTITHPTVETPKIHSGRYAHEHLPVRPCANTPVWHLRTNNMLALQAAFQCGTVHHACQGVSLAKETDADQPHTFGTTGARVMRYLGQWAGPLSEDAREGLMINDLRGLDNLIYLYTNDPLPGR